MESPAPQRQAVFLDRDGVLNQAEVVDGIPRPPADLTTFQLLPGVEEACRALAARGLLLVVVTNQPDIARGTTTAREVAVINDALRAGLPIDDILVCPHDDVDRCDCRKPAPGLLVRAARAWNVALDQSFMVGDRWRDIEAGRAAGCMTVLIDHGYPENAGLTADLVAESLLAATPWILSNLASTRPTAR